MAFKKGQSGNPGGRPKGSMTLDLLDLLKKRAKAEKKDTEYYTDEFVAFLLKNYKKDTRLAVWMADHIFGKATQPISGPDGGPIQVEGVEVVFKKKK